MVARCDAKNLLRLQFWLGYTCGKSMLKWIRNLRCTDDNRVEYRWVAVERVGEWKD